MQCMDGNRILLESIYFDFVVVFLFVFFFVKGAYFLKVCLALCLSLCLSSSKEEACTWETSPSRCPPLLHLRLLLGSDFRLLLDLEDFKFSQNCIICLILTTFSPQRPSPSSPAPRPSPPSASSSCSPSPPAWPSWGQTRFEEKTIVKKREEFQREKKTDLLASS